MSKPAVPFIDLPAQHQALESELMEVLVPILRNAAFVGGEPVNGFEKAFAEAHGIARAVSVKSGTSALQLGLEGMGLEPGDEVLVPAFTFIATAASVVRAGGRPVFVDVDPETACLDPDAAAAAVTDRTRAILPVHLYGHPAPMAALLDLAKSRGLKVLEDCAQSHLGTLDKRPTGTYGDAGAFSFYPSKNLGALGDGGCFITGDEALADRVQQLANHGRTDRYHHGFLGWNERMDAIQAAALTVKLRHLPGWNMARRAAAARYTEALAGVAPWGEPLVLPVERPGAEHVYHLYVFRHSRRDEIAAALAKEGIGTATHYPLPLPGQPAFVELGMGGGSFPVSDAWAATCLSLPLFPEITAEQQDRVVEALRGLPS
jgi:dTDP-4-amino-4,6-dideoxygalactose transaminase